MCVFFRCAFFFLLSTKKLHCKCVFFRCVFFSCYQPRNCTYKCVFSCLDMWLFACYISLEIVPVNVQGKCNFIIHKKLYKYFLIFAWCQTIEIFFIFQSTPCPVCLQLDGQDSSVWKICLQAHSQANYLVSYYRVSFCSTCQLQRITPCLDPFGLCSHHRARPRRGVEALGAWGDSATSSALAPASGFEVPISSLTRLDCDRITFYSIQGLICVH